jgi:hypothetical protein
MGDEELRGRYRRDYTSEPIGRSRSSTTPEQNLNNDEPPPSQQKKVGPMFPIREQPASSHPLPAPTMRHTASVKPNRTSKRAKVLISIVLLLLLGGGGVGFWQYHKNLQLVPAQIKSEAEIPILYPNKLPTGFSVVKSSFNVTNGNVIVYYATDVHDNHINFTVQARPANFDFDKFYSQVMSNASRFSTPAGEAAVGNASGHILGSLASDKSWLLVTGNSSDVGADKIRTAISDVKVIN